MGQQRPPWAVRPDASALRNSVSDKRRGRALWRHLDPPDRLLSAEAKEANSPCGKVGEKTL